MNEYLNDENFRKNIIEQTKYIFYKENYKLLEYIRNTDESSINLAEISSELVGEFDDRISRVSEVPGYPNVKIDLKNEMLQAAIFILKEITAEITAEIPIFTNQPPNEKDILKPRASKTSNKGEDITQKFSNQKKRAASPIDGSSTPPPKKPKYYECDTDELPLSQYYNRQKDGNISR